MSTTPTGSGMLSEGERDFVEAWREGRPVLPETWEQGATKFLAIIDRLLAANAALKAVLAKVEHEEIVGAWCGDGRDPIWKCASDCLACERDRLLGGGKAT